MQSNSEILVRDQPQSVMAAGAELFANQCRTAVAERGQFCVALTGGTTPEVMYRQLASDSPNPALGGLPWDKVQFFWGDERSVGPDHADSNYRMAYEAMLKPLAIPDRHVHRMVGESTDLPQAAADYQNTIARILPTPDDRWPQFDLVLLGMGADGHCASLFPHTRALAEHERAVVANHVPQQSTWRMTMTAPLINAARLVCFLVTGEPKAKSLRAVLEGPANPQEYPSQLIQPTEGKTIWLLDEAAASQLGKK